LTCHDNTDPFAFKSLIGWPRFSGRLPRRPKSELALVRNWYVWKKLGDESEEFLRGAKAAQRL
jgi:hypothetical protein